MTVKKNNEIVLSIGSEVVVRSGQAQLRVTFSAGSGTFDIRSDLPNRLYVPVGKDSQLVITPRIGEVVEKGWKYAGISPTTGYPLFVATVDQSLCRTWKEATDEAAALRGFDGYDGSKQKSHWDVEAARRKDAHDHGIRLPSSHECRNNLYPNRQEIGGFKSGADSSPSLYWSSTWMTRTESVAISFSDGQSDGEFDKRNFFWVRLVRS